MTHEAVTLYLRDYNTAISTGEPAPNMHGRLTDPEADRVTRFLTLAPPAVQRSRAAGRPAVRRAVVTAAVSEVEVVTGSIADADRARLAEFAAGLGITQEGER